MRHFPCRDRQNAFLIFIITMLTGIMVAFPIGSAAVQDKKPSPLLPQIPPPEHRIAETRDNIPDWLARWELARALSYSRRYDESIREYEKLLRERPDLSEGRIELATVCFWNGKPAEALRQLEQVPAAKMTDKAQVLMADLYVRQKKYERAAALYRNYLKVRPDDLRVRLRLAEVLSWEKKYDASLKEYEEILKARPGDIQVRRKYGFVLMWMGRFDAAARELKKTLP